MIEFKKENICLFCNHLYMCDVNCDEEKSKKCIDTKWKILIGDSLSTDGIRFDENSIGLY